MTTETPEESPASSEAVEAPHEVSLLVWGGPSPAIAGAPAAVTVGARCEQGCDLRGATVEVRDASGAVAGQAVLEDEPRSDTDALYAAEVSFRAPVEPGAVQMTVTCAVGERPAQHLPAGAAFGFRVDPRPDHEVRVRVVFGAEGGPAGDVEVWMNHYARRTDAAGEAVFQLPRGRYTCSIRKLGLTAQPIEVDVSSDLSLEIGADRGETREELEARLSAWESYPWS